MLTTEKEASIAQIFEDSQTEQYRTLGKRFFASLFDSGTIGIASSILLLPLLAAKSQIGIVVYSVLVFVLTYVYYVAMNYFFGGSLGKLLLEVRIVDSRSNQKVSLLQALLREILSLFVSAIILCLGVSQLLAPSPDPVHSYFHPESVSINSIRDLSDLYSQNLGLALVLFVVVLWGITEFLVSLANRKRRALHDYVAGTVVIALGSEYRSWSRLICIGMLLLNGTVQQIVNGMF